MLAIYKKEIIMFFTTMEAYVAISVFFCINGLILWYIPSEFNIFYNKQASLLPFFTIEPWVLLLLIPAITMKLINSELRTNLLYRYFSGPLVLDLILIFLFTSAFGNLSASFNEIFSANYNNIIFLFSLSSIFY